MVYVHRSLCIRVNKFSQLGFSRVALFHILLGSMKFFLFIAYEVDKIADAAELAPVGTVHEDSFVLEPRLLVVLSLREFSHRNNFCLPHALNELLPILSEIHG